MRRLRPFFRSFTCDGDTVLSSLATGGPRQQDPPFPTLPAPMLASPCRQSLNPPSGHANKARILRAAGAYVGVTLPAKPYSFVEPRQQDLPFPALSEPMLASPSRQSLNPSSGHANKARPFPRCRRPCWRRPARRALILRRGTPTRPALSRAAGAYVGVTLPAKPYSFVEPRQQDLPFPALSEPMLASPSRQSLNPSSGHANKARPFSPCLQSLNLSSGHANKLRPFPRCRRLCWRRPLGKALILRLATPTNTHGNLPGE